MLKFIADDITKYISRRCIVKPEMQFEAYRHNTFIISSLSDYINIISLLDKFRYHPNDRENTICYRGMESAEWRLQPSITRLHLLENECHMVNDFLKTRPNEFMDCKDNFDLLAKMQHYGLPTRLLDFTLNPLVALYFACIHNHTLSRKVDGRVVCFLSDDYFTDTHKIANVICSMYKFYYDEIIEYKLAVIKNFWLTNQMSIEDYFDYVYNKCHDGIICKPSYISQREINQQAILMIFPNNILSNGDTPITNDQGCDLHHDYIQWHEEEKINDSGFENSLKEIEKSSLENQYISILVKANKKDEILQQLGNIGINRPFLFPELEYQAEAIKFHYQELLQNETTWIKKVSNEPNPFDRFLDQ